MDTTNKDILQKANAAVSAGDYEGFLSYCTDDTTWIFVGEMILQGKEAVRQYMKEAYVEPPQFMVENVIAEGDYVTALGTINQLGEDGKIVAYAYCDFWRFDQGKMAELRAFVIEATSK